jgi:hypothetical protein
VTALREIEILIPLKEPTDKTRMFRTLLKGQALSYFEHHLRRVQVEDSEFPDNELIELVLRYTHLEESPKRSKLMKNYYMRRVYIWVLIYPYIDL